ncbi:hypothetical protein [Williamsia herbipolensis]|uniref:hypothetical protein n=1 Tax=Williamsia herbipolensis TaxID=1603258 RepID=UPI000A785781|nr:hypothetical protein [Williamsia herbipolensis]
MTRRVMGVLAAAAVCAVLAGCGDDATTMTQAPSVPSPSAAASSDPPLTMQPGPTAQPGACGDGRICSPDQVIVSALEAVFSYRGTDTSPADSAAARAGDLLSSQYRTSVDGTWSLLAPITGAQWAQWKADKARVTAAADVQSDEHPPDSATTASRVVTITQTVTPGGEKLAPMTVWVVASAGGPAGWQLSSITTQ